MSTSRIKTALLSYGMSGEVFHGPLLEAHDGFEIACVWQRNPNRPAKHNYPVVHRYEDILKNDEVELVIVNTPNALHYEQAAAALHAGKHVVVEKPFTVTRSEADRLISLAEQQQCLLTVFQNRRWDNDFLTVRKVLGEGLLGTLVECEIHYDRFRNYIEADTWKEEPAPGTGILYNLGSHIIDQALVLFGMPKYVDARIGVQRPGGKVDDFFDIRMEYDGLLVILKSSYLVREQGPRFILHGTQGSFLKKGLDPQEQALKDKAIPGSEKWGVEDASQQGWINTTFEGKELSGPLESIPGNYLAFYDSVWSTLREGKVPEVTAEEARNVIAIIEACQESGRLRQAIEIG